MRGLFAIAALVALQSPLLCDALPPHPRLMLNASRLEQVQVFIASNAQAASYFRNLTLQGDYVLAQPPIPAPPANSSAILLQARSVLNRVYITSLLYRLTSNETYAARAALEMASAANWSNWNVENHALDTGELSHALAVGFDWINDWLATQPDASLRSSIVDGLIRKGLQPFWSVLNSTSPPGWAWWVANPSNWCIVTNAGAAIGALALLGEPEAPSWLPALLSKALADVKTSIPGFAPDGAWWEGPIYHGYSARYLVPLASSLETATGSDGGLFSAPGVSLTARYQMTAMDTPGAGNFKYFNWADSEEGQETLGMLLAVAERAGDGAAAWSLRARVDTVGPPPLSHIDGQEDSWEYANTLLHFTDIGSEAERAVLPLDSAYPNKMLAFFRSSWSDTGAFFLAVKGVNTTWNHGDLDGGSFVFSYHGHRLLSDLGSDNYDLPGYFSPSERFTYYRKNNRGHNTLQFDSGVQTYGTAAPLSSFTSNNGTVFSGEGGLAGSPPPPPPNGFAASATIDLTSVYAAQGVANVSRTFLVAENRSSFKVVDTWALGSGTAPSNITWAAQTLAAVNAISPDGSSVTLLMGTLLVSITVEAVAGAGCSGATWTATPIRLAPPQYSTLGLTRLQLVLDARACTGITVAVGPTPAA